MKVRNINGTSDNDCPCGSWLEYWEKFSGLKALECSALNCKENNLDGAHIQKEDTNDNSWYIIPLCRGHNGQKGKTIDIKSDTRFVHANESKAKEEMITEEMPSVEVPVYYPFGRK